MQNRDIAKMYINFSLIVWKIMITYFAFSNKKGNIFLEGISTLRWNILSFTRDYKEIREMLQKLKEQT